MAHRAKLPSFRLFISPSRLTHGCACFVPEPGQNIHLPLSKEKAKRGDRKSLMFFLVRLWVQNARVSDGVLKLMVGHSQSSNMEKIYREPGPGDVGSVVKS